MKDTEEKVLKFWFEELSPKNWFEKSDELDARIITEFKDLHTRAHLGELYKLRKTPLGRLSEIIILDQFSRNIYRNDPKTFSSDAMALALSQEAISLKIDIELTLTQKSFLYMPFMHSESLAIHDIALKLFSVEGLEANYDFEIKHRNIIEKYGRYPHRNVILNRESTSEEIIFLNTPGSSF